jgi:hypothetical protein
MTTPKSRQAHYAIYKTTLMQPVQRTLKGGRREGLKLFAWYQDENGQVWLAYNNPAYMAQRHNIKGCDEAVAKVTNALAKFAVVATE